MFMSCVWWLMSVILTPIGRGQGDNLKFESGLGFIASSRADPVSDIKQQKFHDIP